MRFSQRPSRRFFATFAIKGFALNRKKPLTAKYAKKFREGR
jgi:hypothetical protein